MDNQTSAFHLYQTQFQHLTKTAIIDKRKELFNLLNGDIFYPISLWPHNIQLKFWNKPSTDQDTFNLFLFFFGNGCSPNIIFEWILTSQYWSNNKGNKRARQLDFLTCNTDNKKNIWFYFDLFHEDWRFVNGEERKVNI